MSRKKWGKSVAKSDRVVRTAIPRKETLKEIDEYLENAKSVTEYDLANKFNIRMSVAKDIMREKQAQGELVPYIRKSGFVIYTRPDELERRERGRPILIAEVLEEVASTAPEQSVIDDEMDLALAAAASMGSVKPSRLARKRREAGEMKERARDKRPEVVVEPLAKESVDIEREEEVEEEAPKKEKPAKKEAPKKEKPAKKEAPKKETPKEAKAPKKKLTLEDIPGVGEKTRERLIEAGFKTVAKIAKTAPGKIADKVDGVGQTGAENMVEEAKKLIESNE